MVNLCFQTCVFVQTADAIVSKLKHKVDITTDVLLRERVSQVESFKGNGQPMKSLFALTQLGMS